MYEYHISCIHNPKPVNSINMYNVNVMFEYEWSHIFKDIESRFYGSKKAVRRDKNQFVYWHSRGC